jgi:6-phosphogluconolactonase (cycloisomerase 2 family)
MARTLFVGSYGGEILTVQLDQQTGAVHSTSNTTQSAPSPSWQEIAQNGTVLYTVEENTAEDAAVGAITSYKIGPDGVLTKIASAQALASVVNLAVSPDQKTIFAAS